MDLKIFLIQLLVFSEVYGQDGYKYVNDGGCATATQLYPSKIKSKTEESVELCYELCRDTEDCAYFEYDSSVNKLCHLHPTGITRGNGYPSVKCYKMEVSSEGSASGSPCRDDWKGDGECDEVNNNAKCNYDGGDCPRKCFADDNDPLDIAYTSKYGPSWYNKIEGNKALLNGTWSDLATYTRENYVPDEQGFFPNITNQNECMALGCELRWQCSDCCWIWDHSWEQVTVSCKLTNAPGSPFLHYGFGPGCYCQTYGVLTVHECCLRDGAPRSLWHDFGPVCTSDLESREHPCNNIEGITELDGHPLLPPTEKTNRESGCGYGLYKDDPQLCCVLSDPNDRTKCKPRCIPTTYISTLANMMKNSGGKPKRFRGKK